MQDYKGGRTEHTIISWVNKNSGVTSNLVTCAQMKEKVKYGRLNLHYFGELNGSLYDAFIGASKDLAIIDKFNFYHTTDVACGKRYGLKDSGIALTRKFDTPTLQFTGNANQPSVLSFAKDNMMPILWTLDNDAV